MQERDDADGRDTGTALELGGTIQKEGGIAPQLVDDEPPDQATVVVGEEGEGAVERGEHPPAVDVADHDGRRTPLLGRCAG